MTDLRERIAKAIESTIYDSAAHLNGRLQRECLVYADAVLADLGLDQVGWYSDRVHNDGRGTTTHEEIVCVGCLAFVEEDVPSDFVPVYRVRPVACNVCNGTGLSYDSTECRMVPCGGICCRVRL